MADHKIPETGKDVFEWIDMKEEIGSSDELFNTETGTEKLLRKVKENPFVPLGALATVGCLTLGLYSFRKGEKRLSQIMMRSRVVAQGFTVLALVAGIAFTANKNITKKE